MVQNGRGIARSGYPCLKHNAWVVDYKSSRFFIQMRTNVNVTYASESLSKMMAVCRRLPATEPLDTQQPGAARRGPAREHPGGPFGNERGRRRPRKSGAGRVSPSREAAPAQASAQLWASGTLPPNTSRPLHSLKGMVPEAAAHVPVVVCGRCVGGSAAQ